MIAIIMRLYSFSSCFPSQNREHEVLGKIGVFGSRRLAVFAVFPCQNTVKC